MKKVLLLLTLVTQVLYSFGQTTIILVTSNPQNQLLENVEVFDLSQKEFFQVDYKDTLSFKFKKDNIDCYNIRYNGKNKIFKQQLWLNAGSTTVVMQVDSTALRVDTVLQSPIYYEHLDFKIKYDELYEKKDTVSLNKLLLDGYSKHIENPYSFVFANIYINYNKNSKSNLRIIKQLIDKQGDKFDWFLLYKAVNGKINSLIHTSKITLNNYRFLNRQGEDTTIAAQNWDYMILDFWFLKCPPCVKDHKEIPQKIGRLKNKNAVLIGISIDNNLQNWNAYLDKHQYNWENYMEGASNSIRDDLGIAGFPTYVILDKYGNVLNFQNTFDQALDWLNTQ